MAKKKEENSEPVDSSKQAMQGFLEDFDHMHFNGKKEVKWNISTGSLILDTAMGGIVPGIIRLCGQNNEGKTPQSLEIIRQFFISLPRSKAMYILAEGRGLTEENMERCGLKFVYSSEEWEIGTVFVFKCNAYQAVIEGINRLLVPNESDIRFCIILDSLDALAPYVDRTKAREEKDVEKPAFAPGIAKLTKMFLGALTHPVTTFGHLIVMISQATTEVPKTTPSGKVIKGPNRGGQFSGGNAALHGVDWILEYANTTRYDYLYDTPEGKFDPKEPDKEPIGKEACVTIMKSAREKKRFIELSYPIKFGKQPCAIWVEKEIIRISLLPQLGLLKRNGGWLAWDKSLLDEVKKTFPEMKEQIQGEDKMTEYLEQNPELTKILYSKVIHFLSCIRG